MNIEYIRYQKNYVFVFEYLIFVAEYSNIQIYSFYTMKFGKSHHAKLKNEYHNKNYDKMKTTWKNVDDLLTEYEYQIYSFLATYSNIKYICS